MTATRPTAGSRAAVSPAAAGPGAFHQFVRTLEPGAVGAHVLEMQRLSVDLLGLPSTVFAEQVDPAMEGMARPYTEYGSAVPAGAGDVLVYHLALGSVIADFLADRTETLIVNHHNVTPPRFNDDWAPESAYECAWGIHQLRGLAARAALGVGDSRYNEGELARAGYAATASAPVLFDLSSLGGKVERPASSSCTGDPTEWLFVGRVAPNKCQHELVTALAVYRRLYDPLARLVIVGAPASDRYATAVERHAAALGLGDAVRLTGAVDPDRLRAQYRAADVFVCLSEHEGYCVPLVEAMSCGVPIVAYASSAVPETLGDAGLLLATKEPLRVAAAVDRVRRDRDLRAALCAAATARVAQLDLPTARSRWVEVLEDSGLVPRSVAASLRGSSGGEG